MEEALRFRETERQAAIPLCTLLEDRLAVTHQNFSAVTDRKNKPAVASPNRVMLGCFSDPVVDPFLLPSTPLLSLIVNPAHQ